MAKAKAKKEEKKASTANVQDYQLVLKPIITEKASQIGNGLGGGVAFRVDRRATKDEIKAAIERVFNVQVTNVRTCNYIGKVKRTTRSSGRRAAFKKAYITLAEGQSIDLVEGL